MIEARLTLLHLKVLIFGHADWRYALPVPLDWRGLERFDLNLRQQLGCKTLGYKKDGLPAKT